MLVHTEWYDSDGLKVNTSAQKCRQAHIINVAIATYFKGQW